MNVEKLDDIKCTRFLIDGKEYLRVGGVWFEYTEEKYIAVDKPLFEKIYMEKYDK